MDKLTQSGIEDPYLFSTGIFTDNLKCAWADVPDFNYLDLYHRAKPISVHKSGIKHLQERRYLQVLQGRIGDRYHTLL